MKSAVLIIITFLASISYADRENQYVPGGQVVQQKSDEIVVKDPKGNLIEIEFTISGTLEEASGNSVTEDTFEPGEGMLSLSEIVSKLKAGGKSLSGEWSYEHGFVSGWYYEVQEFVNGREIEYLVSAKTGEIISTQQDD